MNNTNTGGPAFPVTIENGLSAGGDRGMTLRDFFAAKAMQGFVSSVGIEIDFFASATDAYAVADAMLKARTE
jgi:hypothetical protein